MASSSAGAQNDESDDGSTSVLKVCGAACALQLAGVTTGKWPMESLLYHCDCSAAGRRSLLHASCRSLTRAEKEVEVCWPSWKSVTGSGKRQKLLPHLFQQQLCTFAIKVIVYLRRQMPRTSEMILLTSSVFVFCRYMLYAVANIQVDQKDCGTFAMPIPP